METAQEVAAYEPEEDETVTAAVIKKALKDLIDDLKGSRHKVNSAIGGREVPGNRPEVSLQAQEDAISAIEKRIKDSKAR